jgi:hypothetical protein
MPMAPHASFDVQRRRGYAVFAPAPPLTTMWWEATSTPFSRKPMHPVSRRPNAYNKLAIDYETPDQFFNAPLTFSPVKPTGNFFGIFACTTSVSHPIPLPGDHLVGKHDGTQGLVPTFTWSKREKRASGSPCRVHRRPRTPHVPSPQSCGSNSQRPGYTRALEARVTTLEATVRHLTEPPRPRLAYLLAAPIGRFASGDHQTVPSRPPVNSGLTGIPARRVRRGCGKPTRRVAYSQLRGCAARASSGTRR